MSSTDASKVNQIRGQAKSIFSLLLKQKYEIDYYQRDYKWEEKQIKELIDDLTMRFDQDFDPAHERGKVQQYGQYFLGSIIVSEKDHKRYIVDGQQRLTSLTLLLVYLDRLQKDRSPADQVEIANLISSDYYGSQSFNLYVEERENCLYALIRGENPDPTHESPSVQNLINRFNDIVNHFPPEFLDSKLPYFLDWLIRHVVLVEITAFSDEDAYTIFETMNDRGLSLTPTEMLKGYLLANIRNNQDRIRAEKAWKKQTTNLRTRGTGKDEDANCIKAWLRSQYAEKTRERKSGAKPEDFEKQGTEFHRWVRSNHSQIGLSKSEKFASFIERDFCFYARNYAKARDAAEKYDPEISSVFFNSQNNFTLQYPLMLAPLEPTDTDEIVQRKMRLVATYIEIMLARRMWNFKAITHSTMQYRAFLIMREIRRLEIEPLRENLIHRLSRQGTEQDDYIDFQTEQAFRLHGNNGPQVHLLLARLTEFLEVGSNECSRYTEYASRSRKKESYQIEHIWANHPQNHEKEFPNHHEFASYRNRIGGLVLLPAETNKSYSDMPYSEKVERYATQNLLARSLHPIAYKNAPGFQKFVKQTNLPFASKTEFTRAALDERQALYIELANFCWSPDQLNSI